MASIAEAVAGLVVLGSQVANPAGGFLASYDLNSFAQALTDGTLVLPVALALEGTETLEEVFGWQATSGMGKGSRSDFKLTHELLFKEVADNADFPALLPSERQLIKNYQLALDANPYLSNPLPTIHFAPRVTGKIGLLPWYKKTYHGVVFIYDAAFNL